MSKFYIYLLLLLLCLGAFSAASSPLAPLPPVDVELSNRPDVTYKIIKEPVKIKRNDPDWEKKQNSLLNEMRGDAGVSNYTFRKGKDDERLKYVGMITGYSIEHGKNGIIIQIKQGIYGYIYIPTSELKKYIQQ